MKNRSDLSRCRRLGNTVCALPSYQPKLCWSAAPRALHLIFCQNLPLSFGIAFGSDCQMTSRGSNFDSNMNFAAWPTDCKVLSALKYQDQLCGVEILFKTPKLRTPVSQCQPSSTRLFVLAVQPAQAAQERGPKSSAIDFALKTFNCLLD